VDELRFNLTPIGVKLRHDAAGAIKFSIFI
jgi:hypothetical protein